MGYSDEDERIIGEQFDKLMSSCSKICKNDYDADLIKRAFFLAKEAHEGVRRRSGEPYILHPLAVARIVVDEIGLGVKSVVAALLHDVVEDTDYTVEDIESRFGPKIALMVDGLTKMSGVFKTSASEQAENFRKVLLTLSDDVRVILIKIADRLHNMRTLGSMPPHKQMKITSETIYLFAPLAYRLGLFAIKSELEDLTLKYRFPEDYRQIENKIRETEAKRSRFIEKFNAPIIEKLRANDIDFEISGRVKSIYSIWSKMQRKHIPFEEIYDIFAIDLVRIRIIVADYLVARYRIAARSDYELRGLGVVPIGQSGRFPILFLVVPAQKLEGIRYLQRPKFQYFAGRIFAEHLAQIVQADDSRTELAVKLVLVRAFVGRQHLAEHAGARRHPEILQARLEQHDSVGDVVQLVFLQAVHDRLLGLRRNDVLEPLGLGRNVFRSDDLDLVAAADRRENGLDLMVDLGPHGAVTDLRVNVVGEIERRSPLRQRARVALGREHDDLGRVETKLEIVQKLDGVLRRTVQRLADLLHPAVELSFLLRQRVGLVLPVRGESPLGDLLHALRADLHLGPNTVGPHDRRVERLVPVRLRNVDPVTDTVGLRLVDVRHERIDVPALRFLGNQRRGLEHDTDREYIVDQFVMIS